MINCKKDNGSCQGRIMKRYKLKKNFRGLKKGAQFFLIVESEFIGIKEFVLRSIDLSTRIEINEEDLQKNFELVN
jgi:hypothetical protein